MSRRETDPDRMRNPVRCDYWMSRYGDRPAQPCERRAHLRAGDDGYVCLRHYNGPPLAAAYLHAPGTCKPCDRTRAYWAEPLPVHFLAAQGARRFSPCGIQAPELTVQWSTVWETVTCPQCLARRMPPSPDGSSTGGAS